METTYVKRIYRESEAFSGKEVKVSGWIRTVRASNAFGFIELNDGSFFKSIQVVFEQELDNFKEISKLSVSASITVEGILEVTPNAKQPFEIKAKKVVIEGNSIPEYPLQKKKHSLEFFMPYTTFSLPLPIFLKSDFFKVKVLFSEIMTNSTLSSLLRKSCNHSFMSLLTNKLIWAETLSNSN